MRGGRGRGQTGEEEEEAKYIGRFLVKSGLQLWLMLSITASQWLRLIEGCSQMLENHCKFNYSNISSGEQVCINGQ